MKPVLSSGFTPGIPMEQVERSSSVRLTNKQDEKKKKSCC